MKKTAYLYVFDGMADWETGYLAAELHSGRFFRKEADRWTVASVGPGRAAVRTFGGLKLIPDFAAAEGLPGDAGLLILPGGDTWLEAVHDPILRTAGGFLRAGLPVAAICGATAGLARTGILNDRPHTSNDLSYLKAVCPNYFGEAYYRAGPVVVDGPLVTATGLAPVEFTYETLKLLGVFSEAALEAWYKLNTTRDAVWYYALTEALS